MAFTRNLSFFDIFCLLRQTKIFWSYRRVKNTPINCHKPARHVNINLSWLKKNWTFLGNGNFPKSTRRLGGHLINKLLPNEDGSLNDKIMKSLIS